MTAVLAAAPIVAVGGCSGPDSTSREPSAVTPSPAGSSARPTAPPGALARRCGGDDPGGRSVAVHTQDGVRLAAFEIGAGTAGVVLLPQTDTTALCGWSTYAAYLAGSGFRVLLIDQRCSGRSACPRAGVDRYADDAVAAVRALRREGATSVALVGASRGGAVAYVAAARTRVSAVAVLSPALLDQPMAATAPRTALLAAPSVRVPVFAAVSTSDPSAPVGQVRALVSRTAGATGHLRLLPGSAHGWQLLDTGVARTPLAGELARFLRAAAA